METIFSVADNSSLITHHSSLSIRPARADEAGLVLEFIKKLAAYEKCANHVVADEATLHHSLFVERSAEVLFAEEDGEVIGFALFFHNFSTFVGRKGLYLEDLFIVPEKHRRRHGKSNNSSFITHHSSLKMAVERNCGRMEWICLHRNQSTIHHSSLIIHHSRMDEWTVQRLDEAALKKFAEEQQPAGNSSLITHHSSLEQQLEVASQALKALAAALDDYDAAQEALHELEAYYGSEEWRQDFAADEAGRLPKEMKRGVLSEDAIWNLLEQRDEVRKRLDNFQTPKS